VLLGNESFTPGTAIRGQQCEHQMVKASRDRVGEKLLHIKSRKQAVGGLPSTPLFSLLG
jgi:hypothetical protein